MASPEVAYWRGPELGASLLRGQFRGFSYDLHTHDTACLALITDGAIRIRMRGQQMVARRGDLYVIDADEPHAGVPLDANGWRQRTIYVDLGHLDRLLGSARVSRSIAPTAPIVRDRALSGLFAGVHRCSEQQGDALKRETHYLHFAAHLFQRHMRKPRLLAVPGREQVAVQRAQAIIHARVSENIGLHDIAHEVGLPPFRLLRAFEQGVGATPHRYQRQARIRLALPMIRAGRSLSDIAVALGFADQAHFTRCFQRAMGVTPGAWRRAL